MIKCKPHYWTAFRQKSNLAELAVNFTLIKILNPRMEGINIKTAKLALEADGNIIGDSFIVQPEKDLAKKLGVLFGIVEIYNINDTFVDAFLEALSDLKTEYYLPPHNLERGVEKRFEEALARANRRIQNAVIQSIEEVDLRNISSVLGISYENKVYISSTGRIKGLFSRRKKNSDLMIFDILAGSQEKTFKPESEKVFANILSGELSEKDALLFINEEFLGYFSQNDLAEITLSNSAADSLKAIEGSLKEKVAKKNFYALALCPDITATEELAPESPLIITSAPAQTIKAATPVLERHRPVASVATPTTPANQHQAATQELRNKVGQAIQHNIKPQQSIDRLIYTQVKTEKYLTPSLMPNWQKFLIIFWTGLKKATKITATQTKKFSVSLFNLISAKAAQIKAAKKPTVNTTTIAPVPIVAAQTLIDPEIIEEDYESVSSDRLPENDYNDIQPEPPVIAPVIVATETTTAEITAVAENSTLQPTTLTGKINHLINSQIERFLSLKKTQQLAVIAALLLLLIFSQSIVVIGRSYDQSTGTGSGYDQIAQDIEKQLNTAEAQNIFNDEAGALAAVKVAKELLNTIPTKRSTNSLKQQLNERIRATSNVLQHLSYQTDPKIIANFNKGQNLTDLIGLAKTAKSFWAFDNTGKNLMRLDSLTDKLEIRTSSLPTIKKLTALDDKNLLLLTKAGDYYKYDIAKNSATKISKPAKEYFQLKNPATASALLDPSLASSTISMAQEADGYSWYLDYNLGKLIVFDKTGLLKKQYAASQFVSSSAFVVQYKEKKAWIFNSGKAYQIDLDF